jgi:hypothetical protein
LAASNPGRERLKGMGNILRFINKEDGKTFQIPFVNKQPLRLL